MTTQVDQLNAFLHEEKTGTPGEAGLHLSRSIAESAGLAPLSASLRASDGALLFLAEKAGTDEERLMACTVEGEFPEWHQMISGEHFSFEGLQILTAPCTVENLQTMAPKLSEAASLIIPDGHLDAIASHR